MGECSQPSPVIFGIPYFFVVASEVEADNPRVAYLCRLHGLEKSRLFDPTLGVLGLPQCKTAFLQKLETDDLQTLKGRLHNSDARELECFYHEYHNKYKQALHAASASATGKDERAMLTRMYMTASALFEFLKQVSLPSPEVDKAVLEYELNNTHKDVTREAMDRPAGLRCRRRHRSQEQVVTRSAGERGGGGSKPKQS